MNPGGVDEGSPNRLAFDRVRRRATSRRTLSHLGDVERPAGEPMYDKCPRSKENLRRSTVYDNRQIVHCRETSSIREG